MNVSRSSSSADAGRSTSADDAGPVPAPDRAPASCPSASSVDPAAAASSADARAQAPESLASPNQGPSVQEQLHAWTPSQFKPRDARDAARHRRDPAGTSASRDNRLRNVREYTLGEEIANSITHGLGAAFAIVALVLLVVKAAGSGSPMHLAAALIYSIAMFVEYLMSTLYHAIAVEKAKRVFKVLDHSGIYLFIAGTYTPFCLITLADHGGAWLAAFVWIIALAGIAAEAFWVFRPRWISAVLYLLLGWSVVAYIPALLETLPMPGFILVLAGGLAYSIGCIFYVLKKIPYMHSIFHVWVVAASVLQFFAVYIYVV